METYDDFRTRSLKDRLAGRWFTGNRTKMKIIIETLGRSMAMTMRILLRKDIGVETFSFWMVLWGFIWVRVCLSINIISQYSEIKIFDYLLSPNAFTDIGTAFLNVFSFFLLVAITWYFIITEFPMGKSSFVDVLSRGMSVVLKPLIAKDEIFLRKEGFVQAAIAPVLGLGFGFILLKFTQLFGVGIYFFGSSIMLFIDEANYHRAKIRLQRIKRAKALRARQEPLLKIPKPSDN